jgi:hypothetical protein
MELYRPPGACFRTYRRLPEASPNLACKEATMSFGKGALLWLIGIPLPIILLLALFWR